MANTTMIQTVSLNIITEKYQNEDPFWYQLQKINKWRVIGKNR